MSQEFFFREGCFITELYNTPDDPKTSIARARVEPGVSTQWHALSNTTERYLILEGVGLAQKGDDDPIKLSRGDVFLIPSGIKQRIQNIGKIDLVFLAICTPRFIVGNYKAM